jgi:elongation factor P--(R)-beta-lysine ligase
MTRAAWWRPDRFAIRRARLEARARILGAVRRWFQGAGFIEVETPALQVAPGMEPHIASFVTELAEPAARKRKLHLHSSPEFAMKKLLAAGMPRIFQFARVFRNGERSDTHHPEFTMLEWYRAGGTPSDLMGDCEGILRVAASAVPEAFGLAGRMRFRSGEADPQLPCVRLSVTEAFGRQAGIDLWATAPDPLRPDAGLLRREAERIGIRASARDSWEDIFFRIFLERIEPHLGLDAPTILHGYPASMAALARLDPRDPRLAQRFELYVARLELANAFQELTDAKEQRRRWKAAQRSALALYGRRMPIDEDFLAAVAALPEAAGIALGFDRLVMLATDAARIEDVLWAPVAEARARKRR